MRARWVGLVAPMLAGLALAAPAEAQKGRLDLALGTASIVFSSPGSADFDTGWVEYTGMLVDITSRPVSVVWELRVRAEDADLGGYGKPVADILWRQDGSTVWAPLSGSDQMVAQGTGDQTVTVHFRIRLDWAFDEPGGYGGLITFSVVRL